MQSSRMIRMQMGQHIDVRHGQSHPEGRLFDREIEQETAG
jgi:hypothetical protein